MVQTEDWTAFVARLEQLGYFRYADPETLEETRAALVRTESLFDADGYFELIGRVFPGDAERLAEGGVLAFICQISPFLQKQGVSSFVFLDQDFKPGRFAYSVSVNLDKYIMLSASEQGSLMAWVAVPARAFALVNKLLEKVGSRERIYTTEGTVATNSLAICLTPELYDAIRTNPLVSEHEKLLTVDELMRLC